MIDGTYTITLRTPLGAKKGDLILKSDGKSLTGAIVVKGKEIPFTSGTADGDSFTFSGAMDTPLGKLDYTMAGRVAADAITGEAKTKKGLLKMSGRRKETV